MFDIKISKIENTSRTNEGSFLQTPFWCEFKAAHGWKYLRFEMSAKVPVEKGSRNCEGESCSIKEHEEGHGEHSENQILEERTYEFSVLVRSFAKGLFSLAYVPLFPSLLYKCTSEEKIDSAFDSEDQSVLIDETLVTPETQSIEFANFIAEIAGALKPYLPKNTICVRFDPDVDFATPFDRDTFNYGLKVVSYADRLRLKKTRVDIQPPDSTLVDLTADEEEILGRMKSKWRYNIRLAEKKGVQIEKILGNNGNLSEKLDKFYELYKITSERDGIAIHPKSYYEDLLRRSAEEIAAGKNVPEVRLYLARHEEDYLGAIITLFSKTESVYLYGCSSNVKRNLMPNFLLQWTAMKDAKAYGSLYYDMYGMPPTDDENHPMHGLYLFKTGFGGKNIHRTGSWDVQLKALYSLCTLAENLRAFWHKKVLKKLRGR